MLPTAVLSEKTKITLFIFLMNNVRKKNVFFIKKMFSNERVSEQEGGGREEEKQGELPPGGFWRSTSMSLKSVSIRFLSWCGFETK